MSYLLPDLTLMHDHDTVRMLDRGKPVGNHDGSPAFHQLFQCLLDQKLCLRIDISGSFIHHKDLRLMSQGSGKGKKLSLSCGEGGASLGDRLLISPGQLLNEMGRINIFRRLFYLLRSNICIIEPDIALHISLKNKHVRVYF